MMNKKIKSRFGIKPINSKYYKTITVDIEDVKTSFKGKSFLEPGYVFAPYIPITVDEIIPEILTDVEELQKLKDREKFEAYYDEEF